MAISVCFPLLLTFLCSSLLTASGTGTFVGLFYNGNPATTSYATILSFIPSRRQLNSKVGTSVKDGVAIPTTNPTIITVPATIPVPASSNNPPVTPLPLPTTIPPSNPTANPTSNSPLPLTNPATTPSTPVTNPATTYPAAPSTATGTVPPATGTVPPATGTVPPATGTVPPATGTVPPATGTVPPATGTVPPPAVTNPVVVAPPAGGAANNGPSGGQGQSWCVAKAGTSATSLQAALDYACGTGGVDCSQIQQGAACYNPNTLQNHASFAFNNYYQKNPVATSCDFGGTAAVVSSNPSSGTCTYPSSSSSSSSSSSPTTTATSPSTPTSPTPSTSSMNPVTNPATTPSSPGNGSSGTSVTPPSVLNSSSSSPTAGTANVFGFDNPPGVVTQGPMASASIALQPFLRFVVLAMSLIAGAVFGP